jgi:tRNA A-37 threonylcarbamoyl transferase component Bud32
MRGRFSVTAGPKTRASGRLNLMQESPDPTVGRSGATNRLADRYLLRRQIGYGGAAEVYEAWDSKLERAVAVKLFRLDVPGLDDAQRHRSEMRILAMLNHPALVAIYDAGTEQRTDGPSRPYLVMELVEGPSLAQRLAAGPLAEGETALLGVRLAGALSHIHGQGIVHRDVKPANVLLADGSPALAKLTDFGIARSTEDARLTGAGLTIGTAQYLSPEQALGAAVGPASDVYSLGLLLLECRTGRPAFVGTPIESALARLHQDPEIPDGVGPALGALLATMTAREPQDRPAAAEAGRALVELAGSTAELGLAAAWAGGTGTAWAGGTGTAWAGGTGTTALLPPVTGGEGQPATGADAAGSGSAAGSGVIAGSGVTADSGLAADSVMASMLDTGVPGADDWPEPNRRPKLVGAAAGTAVIGAVLVGAVAVAVNLRGPDPHLAAPLPQAQPTVSSTSSSSVSAKVSAKTPVTAPVRLTSSARPTPSSSQPIRVVAKPAPPKPTPKPKKSRPRKHG